MVGKSVLLFVGPINAHILYNINNSKKLTKLDFRIKVGKSLRDGFQSRVSKINTLANRKAFS